MEIAIRVTTRFDFPVYTERCEAVISLNLLGDEPKTLLSARAVLRGFAPEPAAALEKAAKQAELLPPLMSAGAVAPFAAESLYTWLSDDGGSNLAATLPKSPR